MIGLTPHLFIKQQRRKKADKLKRLYSTRFGYMLIGMCALILTGYIYILVHNMYDMKYDNIQ